MRTRARAYIAACMHRLRAPTVWQRGVESKSVCTCVCAFVRVCVYVCVCFSVPLSSGHGCASTMCVRVCVCVRSCFWPTGALGHGERNVAPWTVVHPNWDVCSAHVLKPRTQTKNHVSGRDCASARTYVCAVRASGWRIARVELE